MRSNCSGILIVGEIWKVSIKQRTPSEETNELSEETAAFKAA